MPMALMVMRAMGDLPFVFRLGGAMPRDKRTCNGARLGSKRKGRLAIEPIAFSDGYHPKIRYFPEVPSALHRPRNWNGTNHMSVTTLEAPILRSDTGLKIIDADTHYTEPHDLWVKRAPAAIRDRVPQVKMLDGQRSWVIDGDKSIGTGAHPNSAILKDGTKVRDLDHFLKLQFEDVHTGSSSVRDRLQVMDECGIYAQIVYPNILGFGGQAAAKVDADLRLACVQIYNDAMAEVQQESRERLFPMALLPWWDVKEAVKETERTAAMGLRGININSDPHYHKDADGVPIPDLGHPHWDPLWEVCVDKNVPVNFHIGASETAIDWMGQQGWPSLSYDLRSGISGAMIFFNNGKVVSNLIYSGMLDRFPGIKFVSVESGVGWVPFLMEALDYQLKEIAETKK